MSNHPTATMRAMVLTAPNAAFVSSTVARPTPRAGEVLVRIQASGVNPLDTVEAAHARVTSGQALGKVVVDVSADAGTR